MSAGQKLDKIASFIFAFYTFYMRLEQQATFLLLLILTGIFFEGVFSRMYFKHKKKSVRKHFTFVRYFYLILFPIIGVIMSTYFVGLTALKIFLLFAILGPFGEWCIGFAYQSMVGQKLWTYHRFSVNGNTSLLAVPFWGFAGVLFYYLAHIF
jgi:hypothetical protein